VSQSGPGNQFSNPGGWGPFTVSVPKDEFQLIEERSFIHGVVVAVTTFIGAMIYGPDAMEPPGPGDSIGASPGGALGGAGRGMVTIAEGTFPAKTVVTWIRGEGGEAIKGTFRFQGDDISGMQPFADMLGQTAGKKFSVVTTPIGEYAEGVAKAK
jgi:hypothetical protein